MCIFSGHVDYVGDTKIFARIQDGIQHLVYQMSMGASKDVAMILPLPVSSHKEDAVKFISLEAYPEFFKDVAKSFVRATKSISRGIGCASLRTLQVHEVGDFIASFVPHRMSFHRLNEVFRLPDNAWSNLPDYNDYGYAVFQLKPDPANAKQEVHPMAFSFPSRFESKLFFPTVHLHGEKFHEKEHFDHNLYWQGEFNVGIGHKSTAKMGMFVNLDKSQGIVLDEIGHELSMVGIYENKDTIIG
jgi:hypothetical protein